MNTAPQSFRVPIRMPLVGNDGTSIWSIRRWAKLSRAWNWQNNKKPRWTQLNHQLNTWALYPIKYCTFALAARFKPSSISLPLKDKIKHETNKQYTAALKHTNTNQKKWSDCKKERKKRVQKRARSRGCFACLAQRISIPDAHSVAPSPIALTVITTFDGSTLGCASILTLIITSPI